MLQVVTWLAVLVALDLPWSWWAAMGIAAVIDIVAASLKSGQ